MKHNGFSLVELSIVLVILGLLTGGILTGQSLIRAAELRAIPTEVETYNSAINIFKQKYFALPGDINNATNFWGESASGTACATTISTDSATCDGSNDGTLRIHSNSHEAFQFWKHLANAGLIQGNYTGVDDDSHAALNDAVLTINIPESRISGTGYSIFHESDAASWQFITPLDNKHIMFYGSDDSADYTDQVALTSEEAWNIEKKIDDTKPATGIIRTYGTGPRSGCAASNAIDTDYDLSSDGLTCNLLFIAPF